jgi:hypothetical protein
VDAYSLEPNSPATQQAEHPDERRPDLGSPIRVWVWLRRGKLRPAWAALCGALASGGLALSTTPLLRLALLIFLVDVIWGGLWSGLAATDWATPLRRWGSWRRGQPVRFLPYTSSNATAGRLARTWGQLRNWWTELGRPVLGPTVSGLAVLLPLAVVIAGVLGARPLLATLAAITLLQFVFAWTSGSAQPVPVPQALFEIALPWLAAHALFDLPSLPSVLLALAYALSYAGGLRLVQGCSGLARWNLGQFVAVIVLVALRQPLVAGIAGLLFVGQLLFQPGLFDAETERTDPVAATGFVRVAQVWLMAIMLVAAWGVQAAATGG